MMKNEYQKVWLLKQEPEGPLVHYFDLIVSHLVEQGYCRKYIGRQLRVIAHFSLWLKRQKICASDVTLEYAERFIQEADQRHTVKQEMNSILRHLIEFLQQKHICKKTVHPINRTPVQQVVYSFGRYLLDEKGLSNKTLVQYNPFIERFLQSCFGHVPVRLSSLSGKDIIDFIKHEAARLSVARAKVATNALRAFLRYGVSLGDINADLIGSIPTVASWSMTGIPRAISPEHVQAVLDSCDRNTPIGKRDYAILMLLSHLGLRSGEIVSLTLDCIGWECSSIHVCGKGHQSTCLPIPFEVGQAIANYLQYGRPICNDRALFLRTLAPIRGLGAQQTIATIVNSAITRAGVVTPSRGAHQFRHAVATKMLAQGASLTEIGCLLGHKHPKTTKNNQYLRQSRLKRPSLVKPAMARRCTVNLQQTLQDYLIMRRGLGFKLISDGKALKTFVSFLELHQQDIITTKFALSWAKQSTTVQSSRWARRLSIVRSFSRYCRAIEPSSEVPPQDLLPFNYRRPRPHLFMDSDIKKLLQASQQISGNDYFKQTLHCLFGLLSVTGLRISEALDLTVDDVDLETGVLTVRNTKFGKSRLIPLHNTTVSVLVKYCEQREIFLAGQQFAYWFLNQHKERLGYACVRYQFNKLLKSIATEVQEGDRRPHLHDLRHYFARSVLVNWYRDGQDVERCLPKLSAYLGHVETRDTYWYLSVCPELMGAVQVLLEQRWGKRS